MRRFPGALVTLALALTPGALRAQGATAKPAEGNGVTLRVSTELKANLRWSEDDP